MTDEINYSLCQTMIAYHTSGTSYSKLLRIADLMFNSQNSGKTGDRLYPFDSSSAYPDVPMIGMAKNQAIQNELCIWEWKYEDKDKQYSDPLRDTQFYKLVFLNYQGSDHNQKINVSNRLPWDILDNLIDGFSIPEDTRSSILLIVNQTDSDYICIEIDPKFSKREDTIVRIPEGTLLNEYVIKKSDCIDTNNYLKNAKVGYLNSPYVRHIVYHKRTLPRKPNATLILKRFSTYFSVYVDHSLEKVAYPSDKRKIVEDFLSNSSQTIDQFVTFMREYEADQNEEIIASYTERYKDKISILTRSLHGGAAERAFLKKIIEGIPDLREKYSKLLLSEYIDEAKKVAEQTIADTLEMRDALIKERDSLNADISKITLELSELTEQHKQLLVENDKLEKLNSSLSVSLTENSKELRQNLLLLKELLLMDGEIHKQESNSSMINKKDCQNNQNITIRYLKSVKIVEGDPSKPNSIITVVDELKDNLSFGGFGSNKMTEYCKLIIGSYFSRTPLLCIGSSSHKMAEIIALSITGKRVTAISLPTGFNDYAALLSTIKNIDTEYIVLENAVGFVEEYCYIHLKTDVPNKHFIFTLMFEESLNILPIGIYSHFVVINCDNLLTEPTFDGQIIPGVVDVSMCHDNTKPINTLLYKNLKDVLEGSKLTAGFVQSRVDVLQTLDFDDLNENENISMIFPELYEILSIIGYPSNYLLNLRKSTNKNASLLWQLFDEAIE